MPDIDIDARIQAVREELAKTFGAIPSTPPTGEMFKGMTLGDFIEWSDPWADKDYPNALYLDDQGRLVNRRLVGQLVHMYLGRWGWSLKMRLVMVPEGDPFKRGDVVFRWGSGLEYSGSVAQVPARFITL